jgi:hypothetical protein
VNTTNAALAVLLTLSPCACAVTPDAQPADVPGEAIVAEDAPTPDTALDASAPDVAPNVDVTRAPADVAVGGSDMNAGPDVVRDERMGGGVGGGGVERNVRVASGPDDNAELIRLLPIGTTAENAPRRVVLRLDPADLPSLRADDVIMTPAEVQVTTACDIGQSGRACGYSPQVAAQVILTGERDDRDPSGGESRALSEVDRASVTSAEHHYTFAFRAVATRAALVGGFALPCVASGRCHVNLVMWAWDSRARSGDSILIGENEGNYLQNGVVQGDKARLMIVRERNVRASDRVERETSGGGALRMPLDARDTLVYSHPIVGDGGTLDVGEQFYIEARAVVRTTGRARFSTQLFLTRNPRATDPQSLDGIEPRSISEHNGGNCTPGTSPCTAQKVSVFRVTENIRGPVYVQLIARSAVPGGGGGAVVTVDRNDGWLRSTRYPASLR